ncbi:MAG TPA: PEP-CTERM sorting domain-containing protein [Acidobacteriaceae bacterium]|nr:PEP-CTERM sorting domain-containing protein [Acidobacteriaceae bacterium]
MRISRTTFAFIHLTFVSLVLGAAPVCSAASITYNVDLTVGAATVTGYIVTDGTIGTLSTGFSSILDWNLLLTDTTFPCPPPSTRSCTLQFDLTGPQLTNGQIAYNGGDDLSATATQLLFNFSDTSTTAGAFFFETGFSGAVCFDTGPNCLSPAFGAGESLYINQDTDLQFTSLSGTRVIGTASGSSPITPGSIPEPSTLSLLGTGVALLGFRKQGSKQQRKSSIAVVPVL